MMRYLLSVSLLLGMACADARAQATMQPVAVPEPILPTAAPPEAAPPASAPPAPEVEPRPASIWERDTLTDRWFGAGEKLSEGGLSLNLDLTQVYQQNVRGGLSTHRRAGRYSGRFDLELDADMEKLAGLSGGRVYALARGGWSDGIDEPSVASLFGVNGVTVGDRPIDVWQLYYEQSLLDKALILRVGKLDLTAGFECAGCPASFDGSSFTNDEATQFLDGSLINNPTIPFPEPGLGAIVHVQPVEWWYVSAAVADARADVRETGFSTAFRGRSDVFSIYETGFTPALPSAKGPLQGAYRFGLWYDAQPKDRFNGRGAKHDDVGFYTSCDQVLWREADKADDSQGLGAFARYGAADSAVNEVKSFWSMGLQYQGLVPGRDNDVLGFGVGQGRLSRVAGFTRSHETVLEWYYNIEMTPWMHVSPDVQYVANPGGDASVKDAVVVGLRLQMTF